MGRLPLQRGWCRGPLPVLSLLALQIAAAAGAASAGAPAGSPPLPAAAAASAAAPFAAIGPLHREASHRAGAASLASASPAFAPAGGPRLSSASVADATEPVPASEAKVAECPVALASRTAGPARLIPGSAPAGSPGYAERLATTALGWPRLSRWCVWIEPVGSGSEGAASVRERLWLQAVAAALEAWQAVLPLQRVAHPDAAQIRVWRRRPPRLQDPSGRLRASNGRAQLALQAVQRQPGRWWLEPSVEVLLDPGRRAEALQATALHELGHAFGLWGHSRDPSDALAAEPGPRPVLRPSPRDRATLLWLQAQPTRFGSLHEPALPADPAAPGGGGHPSRP